MKNQKILVDREPLSKKFIQSKQDFGTVLSHVKNLKPPIWKTPWFYGPVGLAVVAITVSAVNINPKERMQEHMAKGQELEKVLPLKEQKIETQTLAVFSPTEVETPLVEEEIPKRIVSNEVSSTAAQKRIKNTSKELAEKKGDNTTNSTSINGAQESKTKSISPAFPNIGGVYTGEIPLSVFCSENGIVCKNAEIQSFNIQYYNGIEEVSKNVLGNDIPDEACDAIAKYNWGSTIFITKIMGVDSNDNILQLPSMILVPH